MAYQRLTFESNSSTQCVLHISWRIRPGRSQGLSSLSGHPGGQTCGHPGGQTGRRVNLSSHLIVHTTLYYERIVLATKSGRMTPFPTANWQLFGMSSTYCDLLKEKKKQSQFCSIFLVIGRQILRCSVDKSYIKFIS